MQARAATEQQAPGGPARLGTGGAGSSDPKGPPGFIIKRKCIGLVSLPAFLVPPKLGTVGTARLSQSGDMLRQREEQACSAGQEAKPRTRWRQTDGRPCAGPGSCRRAPGPRRSVHRAPFPVSEAVVTEEGITGLTEASLTIPLPKKSWNVLLRTSTDPRGSYIRWRGEAEEISSF